VNKAPYGSSPGFEGTLFSANPFEDAPLPPHTACSIPSSASYA
jgi:hypothetical protein